MLYLVEWYTKEEKHCHLMAVMRYSKAGISAGISLII